MPSTSLSRLGALVLALSSVTTVTTATAGRGDPDDAVNARGLADAAAAEAPTAGDIFAFMHVPKTGGTSLGVTLDTHCRKHGLPYWTDMLDLGGKGLPDVLDVKRRMTAKAWTSAKAPLRMCHGHHVNYQLTGMATRASYPNQTEVLSGFNIHYATFMRDPVERMLSFFLQASAGRKHEEGITCVRRTLRAATAAAATSTPAYYYYCYYYFC